MAYTGNGANNLITLSQLYDGLAKAKEYTDSAVDSYEIGTLSQYINGSKYTYEGTAKSWPSIYPPTTSGTSGYELISTGSAAPIWRKPIFAVCSTAAATAAKTVTVSNFYLVDGVKFAIEFTYENTASNPTLSINSSGAIPIYFNGEPATNSSTSGKGYRTTWFPGEIIEFVYRYDDDTPAYYAIGRSSDILSNFYSNGYTSIDEITTEFTDTKYNSSTITTAVADLCSDLYKTGVVSAINPVSNTGLEYQLTSADGGLKSITLPGLDTINTALINTGTYTDGIGDADSDLGIVVFFDNLNDMQKGTYSHNFGGMEEIADSVATLLSKFNSVEVASNTDVSDMLATVFG